jgi:uncharacterized protein YdhG (YjbR/CyaY superfamily)
MATKKPASIDEYIAGFPKTTQTVLEQVRAIVKNAAPDAEETISYAIPTFTVNKKYLVYFAGYKNHVSLYPAPTGNAAFEKEIRSYRSGKGTVQFQLDKPLPIDLITKIVRCRMKENLK